MLLDHFYSFGLLLEPSGLKKKFVKGDAPPRHTFARPGSIARLKLHVIKY